jgi:hypothetical protein
VGRGLDVEDLLTALGRCGGVDAHHRPGRQVTDVEESQQPQLMGPTHRRLPPPGAAVRSVVLWEGGRLGGVDERHPAKPHAAESADVSAATSPMADSWSSWFIAVPS